MKLLIGDQKKLHSFQLPNKIDQLFAINFDYYLDGTYFTEIINLKASNNRWVIYAENKIELKQNDKNCNMIVVSSNSYFEIKYADIPNFIPVFVLPDFVELYQYSISNIGKIDIGSTISCQIYIPNFSQLACSIVKGEKDYYALKNDFGKCYLNNYSFTKEKLQPGDVLFINGMVIIYMRNYLMLFPYLYQVTVNALPYIEKMKVTNIPLITPVSDVEKNIKLYKENQLFVHSPRLKQEIEEVFFSFELPPQKEVMQKTPIIFTIGSSAIMTMTSSVSIITSIRSFVKGDTDALSLMLEFVVFGLMLVSGLMLPYLMDLWEKHTIKKKERLRQKKYKAYLNKQEDALNQIVIKQTNILNNNNLPLEKILTNILNGCKDVWNREMFDNDFLTITIGIGNLPAKINIDIPKKTFSLIEDNLVDLAQKAASKKYVLQDVPITISILKNRVVPIVIDSENRYDYIHSIMLQLIYFHSGNDLKIITITDETKKSKWEYMKYLSHSWNKDYDRRFFATNSEEVAQISMYLEQEYELRRSSIDNQKINNYSEYYLIVTDSYAIAHDLSILNKIFNSERDYGFYLLIFEDSIKNLPSQFTTLVQVLDKNGVIIERDSINQEQLTFVPTFIADLDIDNYSKVIANIPINIKNSNTAIPSSVSFLELYNATRVDQLNILSRWTNNNPTLSLNVPIGVKENNKLVELDLHEKYHGPHGLIAGSTGSGKSEFIITYILSLAINYHPYEVQFVLIDYKGGGLAGAFERREAGIKIPHLVGTITNLDVSEMNRTLTSIKSELQRRQRVFNEAREKNNESTIDIYKYQRLYREGKVTEPMSHLFIISDEFAELKVNQPDFMDELVSAARIGRSLGIHLILATQKPSGVVDDQIWANTRFRVCLKVQTTEDSIELLKRNDAAFLTDAGRFYLQVGNNELFELGQSGWAGAKYIEADRIPKKLDDDIVFIANNGEAIKMINEDVKQADFVDKGDQLTNVVQYLYDLAVKENIKFSSLWKENIPEKIYYEDIIKKYNIKPTMYNIEPIIGEYDDPEHQEQGYVSLPLNKCGNTFIVGTSGSGKTTLLSNIIFSTIVNHNCDEVNIYVIDFGVEKLKEFQDAPQVGEVLTIADADKIKFLFYMLQEEKNKRFAYYSSNGRDFETDLKNKEVPFPSILVIINQFEVFKENFEDIVDNDFGPFTRNCTKVGITFIVAATQISALSYGYDNNFPEKILLNMLDPTDYKAFFETDIIPKKNPGRGIIYLAEPFEFQVPLLFKDNYENNLNYIISRLCLYIKKRARRVPIIPDEISYDLLEDKVNSLKAVPVGINIQTAQVSTYNFDNLLNVFCAESHNAIKNFLPVLTHLLGKIENTKVIIINSIKSVKLKEQVEGAYYDGNFASVIKVINNNVIKYQENPSDNQFVIFFLGYSQLQEYLKKQSETEDVITVDNLILNAKSLNNFKFVIYDNDRGLSDISDSNIDLYFKRNNGIWLGKGFESQSLFDVAMQYDNNTYGNGTITIIKNGKTEHVKYM